MRNLLYELSKGPRIIFWLVFFFLAFLSAIIPFFGPGFLGFLIFRMAKTGQVKRVSNIFVPTILGILVYPFFLHLATWEIENIIVVSGFNVIYFFAGFILAKISS